MVCQDANEWCAGKCQHANEHEWHVTCRGYCLRDAMKVVESLDGNCKNCSDMGCEHNPGREKFKKLDLKNYWTGECPLTFKRRENPACV